MTRLTRAIATWCCMLSMWAGSLNAPVAQIRDEPLAASSQKQSAGTALLDTAAPQAIRTVPIALGS